MIIIETTCNQLYRVEEFGDAALAHVWRGVPVKSARGRFVDRFEAKPQMVRKEGSRIVTEAQST